MPPFRPLPDHELERLEDDELIAYIVRARDHGELAVAQRGLAILVFGHWRNVERRVVLKVPSAHVENLTGEIIERAIQSAFDGESVGRFVSWLKTITNRAIADFYRRGSAPATIPLGPHDADDPAGPEPAALDERGYVETQDAIERVLDALSERDRRVVELLVFEDRPGSDAVDEIDGMTLANAHQIVSRFRRELRRQLGDSGED